MNGLKPYQQIPFQYSLHHENNGKIIVKDYEFLAEPNKDFVEDFIKSLISNLQHDGDILVYNIGFVSKEN